jgi:hypothetical protein
MITQSGIRIGKYPCTGCPTATDIAVQSTRVTRFGGAVDCPLLLHGWLVGAMAYEATKGDPVAGVRGLLHDAHEIVTGEVVAPFKPPAMKKEQEWLDEKIFKRFRIWEGRHALDGLIHGLDLAACDLEAEYLGLPGYRAIKEAEGHVMYEDYFWAEFMRFLYAGPMSRPDWASAMYSVLEAARYEKWGKVSEKFDACLKMFSGTLQMEVANGAVQ